MFINIQNYQPEISMNIPFLSVYSNNYNESPNVLRKQKQNMKAILFLPYSKILMFYNSLNHALSNELLKSLS